MSEEKKPATDKKTGGDKKAQPQPAAQVISLHPDRCKAEACKAKPSRANFCNEHFTWFKQGLITLDGQYAKDFDKKYQQFMKNKKTA